ncbi:unnamed protein product [Paramecium pentaurelia]|uniref:Uncharacterized protein n=1 Tax=Paramecium pentaurelia TaxID=43138 RepID=A0A8S1TSU0_9CILI|nr:unnamed protein product [Paramecium pentaurelia]
MKQLEMNGTYLLSPKQQNIWNIFQRDHSIAIFFCFQLTINALMIVQYDSQLIFTITVCILNTIFAVTTQMIALTNKTLLFKKICIFISRLSTLLMIALLDIQLKSALIMLLHTFEVQEVDKKYFRYFEIIATRAITLFIMIINFDLISIISVSFQFLLELNRLSQVKQIQQYSQKQQTPLAQSLISQQEQDNLWKNRIQMIPVSFVMINSRTQKINFKNKTAHQFFSLFCENDQEFEDLLLRKLQFNLVQDNIDQICQSFSYLKIRQRLRSKQNRFFQQENQNCPTPAPISGSSGLQCISSRQADSLEHNTLKFTLAEIISNLSEGLFQEYIINNSLELLCHQNYQGLVENANTNHTQQKKFQLSGSILTNQQNEEIILLLNDISKQNELQQLISEDEFKSKILESFSHELRTPLNGAINFLSAFLQDSDDSERIKNKYIVPAINSLKIQSYLISDIIDFTSSSTNNLELLIKEFSMRELINEITSLFTMQFTEKQLEFRVDLMDCCTTTVTSDYTKLMQILVNLLQNSIKFSTEGLIVLKIQSHTKDILKFTVTDMGQGVSSINITQIQSYLNNLKNQKEIQLNKTWQGFGLLISAMLVSKLGPSDKSTIKFESDGINMGSKVSFFIRNLQAKFNSVKQPTIRQNTQRFQSSVHLTSSLNNLNGTIIQTTDQGMKNISKQQKTKLCSQRSNDNSMFSESVVYDSLDQKFGLLYPVQPSLITDIISSSPQKVIERRHFSKNENSSQRSNNSKILSIQFIKQAEEQEDEELLQTYKRRKKCQCQKIMSVDDEIFNQKSIQMLLCKLGFEVILAFNGQQACVDILNIKKCSKKCTLLTLILMDYQMPILNGCQATEKLIKMMNDNIIPRIHIVGLTAFTNSNDIENCLKAGMSDVLHKPLNLKEFKEILTLI